MSEPYRMKTKEELTAEYGPYLENVPGAWVSSMNCLFGIPLDDNFIRTGISNNSKTDYVWHYTKGSFGITMAMVVPLKNARYIIKPCDCCDDGCPKCGYTRELTQILWDSNDKV